MRESQIFDGISGSKHWAEAVSLFNATLKPAPKKSVWAETEAACVCAERLLTLISVMAMSTTLPTTIKASNVFHASAK